MTKLNQAFQLFSCLAAVDGDLGKVHSFFEVGGYPSGVNGGRGIQNDHIVFRAFLPVKNSAQYGGVFLRCAP